MYCFRTDKHTDQIESGFVFVASTACDEQFAVWQDYLKAEHVVPGHSVFETAWSAGVGCDGTTH